MPDSRPRVQPAPTPVTKILYLMAKEAKNWKSLSGIRSPKYWLTPASCNVEPAIFLDQSGEKPVGASEINKLLGKDQAKLILGSNSKVYMPEELSRLFSWRPTPLRRLRNLEKVVGAKIPILIKEEYSSPTGSYKLNTALPQVFAAKSDGAAEIVSETGAGHWANALTYAASQLSLSATVFATEAALAKATGLERIANLRGSKIIVSRKTNVDANKRTNGLRGAISSAISYAKARVNRRYAMGCLLDHVVAHQSIIGIELLNQLNKLGMMPATIVGVAGGGSNLAGTALAFLHSNSKCRIVAVEDKNSASLTRGKLGIWPIDADGMLFARMYCLKQFIGTGPNALGLRYTGVAPVLSRLYEQGLVETEICSFSQAVFAGRLLARHEGIIVAIESAYALSKAIQLSQAGGRKQKIAAIVSIMTGDGRWDLSTYCSTRIRMSDTIL